jgi:polysaccharide biosynthesis protein PslH
MSGIRRSMSRHVIYLTHHVPWPATSGGTVRETNLLTRLAERFVIDLVAVCRPGTTGDPARIRDALGLRSARLFADRSRPGLRRAHFSDAALGALTASGARPDGHHVVHVEGGYLFPHVPPILHEYTCIAEHNVESQVLEQFATLTGDPGVARAAARVARLEERAWRQAGSVVAVTPEDRHHIMRRSGRSDIGLVQNGADHVPLAVDTTTDLGPATALLLGSWAYAPNADALAHTLRDIWPPIIAAVPDARLLIAGAGLSADQRHRAEHAKGVEVAGFVEDLAELLSSVDVLVCPLRAGGGVKVKVLEALRRGCPVVTTPIGAQGIFGPGRAALHLATSTAGLVEHTARLLAEPGRRAAARAAALVGGANLPTWTEAADELSRIWRHTGACGVDA